MPSNGLRRYAYTSITDIGLNPEEIWLQVDTSNVQTLNITMRPTTIRCSAKISL
jgi:hypothetical protein